MENEKVYLLKCVSCNADFFTEGEKNFYKKKKLHTPKRCGICRNKRKAHIHEKELKTYLSRVPFKQIDKDEIALANAHMSLFIIGNGFDLIHGVPSSYFDFRNSMGRHNELRLALEMYIMKEDLWSNFEESLEYINGDAMFESIGEYMEWFDVKEQHEDDFSAADFFMAAEAAMQPTHIIMRELPRRFRKWINTLEPAVSHRPFRNIISTQARFINFNYTEFLETLYSVPNRNIFYIHGDRRDKNKELILGHSGSSDEDFESYNQEDEIDLMEMRNQTTFDLYQISGYQLGDYHSSTMKNSNNVITDNHEVFKSFTEVETVVAIGHSLSIVDYPYFEMIIKNMRKENVLWYISWYNIGDIKRIEDFVCHMKLPVDQIKLVRM